MTTHPNEKETAMNHGIETFRIEISDREDEVVDAPAKHWMAFVRQGGFARLRRR